LFQPDFAFIVAGGLRRGTAVDLGSVMIQIPTNLGQRILEAARIAAAIHQEQNRRPAEGDERAPQVEETTAK
jgi:hypothetical protein